MKVFVALLLAFAAPNGLAAQILPTSVLHGTVVDAETDERLVGATVVVPTLHVGTVTNAFGVFSLQLPASEIDTLTVEVRFVGYSPNRTLVRSQRAVDIRLFHDEGMMSGATVRAAALSPSTARLTAAEVERLPALLGEADPLKAIQLFPSVRTGSEGSSGVHIRGGSPDQTLLLLDGAPVYNASHLVGVVSVFNTDALQSVALTAGAPPARYGGRLSGVVDVTSRDGSRDRIGGTATVGLLASRATVEGPTFGKAGSFLVSARRSYADILLRPLVFSEGASGGYHFQDINARATVDVGARTRLVGGFYAGSDRYDHRLTETFESGPTKAASTGLGWGNTTATLRAARMVSPRVFASALIFGSRYRFSAERASSTTYPEGSGSADLTRSFEQSSGLTDITGRADIEATLSSVHTVSVGASLERRAFDPLRIVRTGSADAGSNAETVTALGGSAYLSDDLRLGSRASAEIGLRTDWATTDAGTWVGLQPRLRLGAEVGRGWTVGATGGRTWQPLHLLTNAGIGLPTDLWVPPTPTTPPATAWQIAAEASCTLSRSWSASLAAFGKRMDGLVEYRDGAGFFTGSSDLAEDLTTGLGHAVGLEMLLRRTGEHTDGWLSYSLSRSRRTFGDIDGGASFPYRYDRTHDLSLAVTHRLSPRRRLSTLFVYATGAAVTAPVGRFGAGFDGVGTPVYSTRNGARFPAYHRLDVTYEIDYGRGRLALGLYNVYNRLNPYFIEPATQYDPATQKDRDGFRRVSLFPILPSLSYRFAF